MRVELGVVSLLVAATSAAPHPQGGLVKAFLDALAPDNRTCTDGVPCKNTCELKYETGDDSLKTVQETWKESGAGDFLKKFLDENGVEGWTNEMFRQTLGNGKQGGTGFNCVGFPAGTCGPPSLCTDYEPKEANLVHVSISNLYSAYERVHENLQDSVITNLASGIKKAVDDFGPPEKDKSNIFSLLMGCFVLATAFTGPVWVLGSPLTGVVGGLNLAAQSQKEPPQPIEFEGKLEESLGEFYEDFAKHLKSSASSIFAGRFGDFGDEVEDPVAWITDQFAGGKLLDNKLINPAVDDWIAASEDLITKGIAIECMKMAGYFIARGEEMDEDDCEDIPNALWMGGKCVSVALKHHASMTGSLDVSISAKKYDAFTDKYGFDYTEVIQNALDCEANGGDKPDFFKLPEPGENLGVLPPCFVAFEIKDVENFYKQ